MDQSIEEYKTIRGEILRNFEAMERNLIACITAMAWPWLMASKNLNRGGRPRILANSKFEE